MKTSTLAVTLFLSVFSWVGCGCSTTTDYDNERSESRPLATLLTLVDESHQLTDEQLVERRQNIISYLVAEGYIYSGEDLVQSSAFADQIIRAKVALDGSFELTIYRPERIAYHQIDFDPAGYPLYTYFPGDIGYFGNGLDPYYLPMSPFFPARHDHYRTRPYRDRRPNQTGWQNPTGPRPAWDGDKRDSRRGQANQPSRPNRDPRPDDPVPGQPAQNQPDAPRHTRRGNNYPAPQYGSQPQNNSPANGTSPNRPDQTDQRRHHPSGQPRQNPTPAANATTPAVTPAPAPRPNFPPPDLDNRARFRPQGAATRTPPSPPQAPPPPKPAPEPVRESSNNSDSSSAQTENQNRPDPPTRREMSMPGSGRRR